ncbi:ferrochelatase [Acidobacteriia bacterium AH_259_A11_L15]|nr:ferrochelatase [Acidobacteriia bacterium AH_259_A11_L15]
MKRKRLAVVLFQLGGPDSLQAIEPFLFNLFSDPDIIDFPFARLARRPLARLAARSRARKVQRHYTEIGGQSPILELTRAQATALERELRRSLDASVFLAMRYWHPLTAEAVREVQEGGFDELVLLPLYPQYCRVTSGSSLNEWQRQAARAGLNTLSAKVIRDFYQHPRYVDAVVENINSALQRFPAPEPVTLVFTAHGIPRALAEAGDPYREQVEATLTLVTGRGGWGHPSRLCYQSKVGPGHWLQPMLPETLRELAAAGANNVLVIPITFVTDHVETLHEIDIDARAQAAQLGIARFEMMPALNDSPLFIQALADLVRNSLGTEPPP